MTRIGKTSDFNGVKIFFIMIRVWENHRKIAKSYDEQFNNLYDRKVARYIRDEKQKGP